MSKLFQPFACLKEGSHLNPNGIGLGLSICKDILENLDSKIWFITTKIGRAKGTAIAFTLKIFDETKWEHVDEVKIQPHAERRLALHSSYIES